VSRHSRVIAGAYEGLFGPAVDPPVCGVHPVHRYLRTVPRLREVKLYQSRGWLAVPLLRWATIPLLLGGLAVSPLSAISCTECRALGLSLDFLKGSTGMCSIHIVANISDTRKYGAWDQ